MGDQDDETCGDRRGVLFQDTKVLDYIQDDVCDPLNLTHDTLGCPMRAFQPFKPMYTMAVRLQTLRSQRSQRWLSILLGILTE